MGGGKTGSTESGAYFLISFPSGVHQFVPDEQLDGCEGYLIPGRPPFYCTTGL